MVAQRGGAPAFSAAGRVGEHSADFGHPRGAERGDVVGQKDLFGREGVVEAQDTITVHAIGDTELDLGVPACGCCP